MASLRLQSPSMQTAVKPWMVTVVSERTYVLNFFVTPGPPESVPEPSLRLPQFFTRVSANEFCSPDLWKLPYTPQRRCTWPQHRTRLISGARRMELLNWRTPSANTFDSRRSSVVLLIVCNIKATPRLRLFTRGLWLSRTYIATSCGFTVWWEIWI